MSTLGILYGHIDERAFRTLLWRQQAGDEQVGLVWENAHRKRTASICAETWGIGVQRAI